MMVDASSMPETIGSLRARFADPVRFRIVSDTYPASTTPTAAAMYGTEVMNPALMNVMPRAVTR